MNRGTSRLDIEWAGRAQSSEVSLQGLQGLALLLLLQAAGEAFAHAFSLPLPGPVIGMILLLLVLQLSWVRDSVKAASELLLAHLSLLFVPVGVGVITHLDLVSHYGVRLAVVIVLSTWIGLAVTAIALQKMLPRVVPKEAGHD